MLPFLFTFPGVKEKVNETIQTFLSDTKEGELVRETFKGLPQAAAETIGQPAMRGFGAAGVGLYNTGRRIQAAIDPFKTYEDYENEFDLKLKPTGTFQESLYGTNEEITPGSFGRETRGGLGGDDEIAIDPLIGFVMGFADAIPGGNQAKTTTKAVAKALQEGDEVFAKVIQRWGPTIAQKISDVNDKNLLDVSLIPGGEQSVYKALNMDNVQTTIQKLSDSFIDFNKARTETEQARLVERSERAGAAQSALESGTGEAAFRAARGALRGEMSQAELPGISLSPEERDLMFNFIKNTPDLRTYERINAAEGLGRMLGDEFWGGKLPEPSQMKLLAKAFGQPFVRQYQDNVMTVGKKILETTAQIANVPRAIMSSMDASAPLRQGLLVAVDNPKNAVRATGAMFRYMVDERYFNASMEALHNSPMASLRQASGLELTDVSGQNFGLGTKEEAYMTDLIQKVPVLGTIVKASERGYTGFLNKLRADVFDDVAQEYMKGGIRPETHPEEFEGLARFLNVATGRGDFNDLLPNKLKLGSWEMDFSQQRQAMGKAFQSAAPLANATFFSPRFLASRLQILNPLFYANLSPLARRMAMRSVAKLVGTGVGILGLASLNKDFEVGLDPTNSDFGKIRVGNYRYDVWGGFQQPIVAMSRLITGKTTSATSGKTTELNDDNSFMGQTRADVIGRFVRSKLSPIAAGIWDALEGTTVTGEDVTVTQQLQSKLLPFYVQDIIEAFEDEGLLNPALKLAPGLFGVGVQRFDNKSSNNGILPSLPSLPKLPSFPGM